jgi:hypothetical protein
MSSKFFSFIKEHYPGLPDNSGELISDKLISPYTVRLPRSILTQADRVVKRLFALRLMPKYLESLSSKTPEIAKFDPQNRSICMSYDFHVDSDGTPKLIEINTNAAFLLMGFLLYKFTRTPLPVPDFDLTELKQNIVEEARLSNQELTSIVILDEQPTTQRLYIEFLLYNELFNSWGLESQIADPSELRLTSTGLFCGQSRVDFIYNRTTDFYFENPNLRLLKEAYLGKKVTLSPNPHEYSLLADKERLIEWSLDLQKEKLFGDLLESIKDNLLTAERLSVQNSERIWQNKKKFFIKPLTSYGSKGSFRGEAISRTYFDQLVSKNCLVQEYCQAPELIFETAGYPSTKLKYDLRFYVYQDRVQLVLARLYQGQVTNLKTPLGGFAPVIFS